MTSPPPFLSRHFGDYLLVAQLSEDSLGIVYRALYAADERRFVRLRILQADELSADAIERAIHEITPASSRSCTTRSFRVRSSTRSTASRS